MTDVFNNLELLHDAGFNHNHLKPSNIMIDKNLPHITLVDFEFTKQFMEKDHGELTKIEIFDGNVFDSNQKEIEFISTSRRDDLVSAYYLFMTLLNL